MAKKAKAPGFGHNSRDNAQGILNNNGSGNFLYIHGIRSLNELCGYLIDISWYNSFF
jgi:hypothetical protein